MVGLGFGWLVVEVAAVWVSDMVVVGCCLAAVWC